MQDTKTTIRIPWRKGDNQITWDQTCMWAIEHYGLPGKKYICHPTEDYMDFVFEQEVDAIHFRLRWL